MLPEEFAGFGILSNPHFMKEMEDFDKSFMNFMNMPLFGFMSPENS
jgi:hypothetical protein